MQVSCLDHPQFASGSVCVAQVEYGLASGAGILFGPSAIDLQRYVDCVTTSSDCAAVLACASAKHDTAYCAADAISCDGDTRVVCFGGWGLSLEDCTAEGLRCVSANQTSSCSSGVSCDWITDHGHCDGPRIISCASGTHTEKIFDCRSLDTAASCGAVTDSEDPECVKEGTGSCGPDSVRCEGKIGIACSHGLERRVDCGGFASHCVVRDNSLSCEPDAAECARSSPDRCNGDTLEVCVNGHYVATPCSSIGLTTCEMGKHPRCK
jgi:hypothetical protein